ncbi:hypothetical protein, partial [Candidatus Protofrankia californiensis]|uniref:hypothetical protein n=1 Tax=Candidatus Protofrankia californiensis TaxID=1839754 RepID=UPI0019D078A0
PNSFKKLGLMREKSEYTIKFSVARDRLVPLRGGRGAHIFSISGGIEIPRSQVDYIGSTAKWGIL